MSKFLIERYKMGNVNIAVVLFQKCVLSDLISLVAGQQELFSPLSLPEDPPVNKGIVETELEDEILKLRLNLAPRILILAIVRRQYTERVS
jgi:hypothetical protein